MRTRPFLLALLFFAGAFTLFSQHLHFPVSYHPDEMSKVRQVQTGSRNFHHPLLLLNAATLLQSFRDGSGEQAIARTGRLAAALFAAGAVALFSLLGFRLAGLAGGLAGGTVLLFHPRLLEFAHFFKEDTALLFGIALSFLALHLVWEQFSAGRAAFLGLAVGVAASGKYIGAVLLAPALLIFLRHPSLPVSGSPASSRLRLAGLTFLAFLGTMALLNWPALAHPSHWLAGVTGELNRLNNASGVRLPSPPFRWLERLMRDVPVALWTLSALFAASLWVRRRTRLLAPGLFLLCFPFLYGLLLSPSAHQTGRYLLPADVTLMFVGGLGFAWLWQLAPLASPRLRRPAILMVALLSLALLLQLGHVALATHRAFTRDHRRDLAEWMRAHLPPDHLVAYENRCHLGRFLPEKHLLPPAPFAGDFGSFSALQARGVTHVAVTRQGFRRFEGTSPLPGAEEQFHRRAEFYRELFTRGKLVWRRKPGPVYILNPELRLYDIRQAAPSG